jgi:hypothetical protein
VPSVLSARLTYKELSRIVHHTGIEASPRITVFSPHMLS